MQLQPVRVTAPAATPVSVAQCRSHLRVDHSDDDTIIGIFLNAAVARLDGRAGILGRCLVSQTWRLDLACWPRTSLQRLPFCDVSAIDSVKYSDASNVEQTVSSSLYQLHADELGGLLWFRSAFTAPSLYDDRLDPVRITFTAGYGDANAVPSDIKAAILMMVADFYENREDTVVGSGLDVRPLPRGVDALLAPHRRVGL